MIHQSTKTILLPLKLSPVRILSHTAIYTKKETHRGALTFQTPFQGKIIGKGPLNLIVKRTDIKSLILCQLPLHTITIHSGGKICTQSAEKFIHNTHFPIIWCLDLLGSFGSCQDRLWILYLVGGTGLESMCLAFGT